VLFATVTMDGRLGLDCIQRLRPQLTVPVHYDDYRTFQSPLSDFLSAVAADAEGLRIETPVRGQTVVLIQCPGDAARVWPMTAAARVRRHVTENAVSRNDMKHP
jgi:hypothetical protein